MSHSLSQTLHLGRGCGLRLWLKPGPVKVEEGRVQSRETGKMFAAEGIAIAAPRYADGATRQTHKNKDRAVSPSSPRCSASIQPRGTR